VAFCPLVEPTAGWLQLLLNKMTDCDLELRVVGEAEMSEEVKSQDLISFMSADLIVLTKSFTE
jgi:hypothetical protein